METFPFKPNQENIEKRKTIIPFGRCKDVNMSKFIIVIDESPKFVLSEVTSSEMIVDDDEVVETSGLYVFKPKITIESSKNEIIKNENVYVPPSLRNIPVTIKVTNISIDFSKDVVEKLIIDCGRHFPTNIHLVLDRESRESRGYAFVTYSSENIAKEAIKSINGKVIEGCLVLGAEMAKR